MKVRIEVVGDCVDICIEDHEHHKPGLSCILGPFSERDSSIMSKPVSVVMLDSQKFTVAFTGGVDADGNPVPLAGPVTLIPDDPSAFTITPKMDTSTPPVPIPNSFDVAAAQSAGHLGTFKLIGSDTVGVLEIDVTVNSGAEVGLGANISTPVPI